MEKSPKQLEARQKGFDLVKSIYEVTDRFPSKEKNKLISQMRSAAISIPSNIAEGTARKIKKDARQYFVVARGFLDQLDSHIDEFSFPRND